MDCSPPKTKNPDRWIENCPEFSRPICEQLRDWFIRWEPDLTESIKWNMLCFSGRKLVCGVSGCQKHVGLAFFRGVELPDPAGLFGGGEDNTSIRSIRLSSPDGLKREALRRLLHAAAVLDLDPDRPPLPPRKREPWPVPDFFAEALKKHPKSAAEFARFGQPTSASIWSGCPPPNARNRAGSASSKPSPPSPTAGSGSIARDHDSLPPVYDVWETDDTTSRKQYLWPREQGSL